MMTAAEKIGNGRAQNFLGGSASTILLSRGIAQRKKGGYIMYAQTKATIEPSTPPKPSSRSGFASTIKRLAKPSEAQTIDQNEGGKVIRSASSARSGDSFSTWRRRFASTCQLNVM